MLGGILVVAIGSGFYWLQGGRIEPRRIDGTESAADLIDSTFLAYNAARLREAFHLLVRDQHIAQDGRQRTRRQQGRPAGAESGGDSRIGCAGGRGEIVG